MNSKNELIKREFFRWLKEANGCCDSTINSIEKGILIYESFTKHADFKNYNPNKAIAFKEWLRKKEYRGNIGIVVLDGIADLVQDVNDIISCNELIKRETINEGFINRKS